GWDGLPIVWSTADPAVAAYDGRDALRQLRGHLRANDQRRVVMRVHVDESGAHDEPADIYVPSRILGPEAANLRDAIACDRDVGDEAGASGAVHDQAVT